MKLVRTITMIALGAIACSQPSSGPAAHAEQPSVTTSPTFTPAPAPAPVLVPASNPAPTDPLPSWNEGATKQAILNFVTRVTKQGGPDFVTVPERIAVFDNDGTLWSEQPLYVQFAFALDRVRELAPQHPEWKTQEPFKSVLAGDLKTALGSGDKAIVSLITATHSGMTSEEFRAIVERWFATARHPKYGRPYTECVYQPMLELLSYLRASGFKTFIVSGGGVDFMRPITEKAYGIPPEQVIGSTDKLRFEMRDGKPVLVREPAIAFINDGPGKPVGIQTHIGRRPIAAFGNSDGDQQMLQWTAAGPGARLMLLVHHTDGTREVAYDRASHIGKLDRAIDEARVKGWVVASIKDDWKSIFPAPK